MRVIQLTAENVKRLHAVDITPDGDLVVIAGKNGQGKTSVLDALWYALAGGAATRDTVRPIRDGQTRASVRVDLGELIVTRTWSKAGSKLTVENAEGLTFKSPQAMLDDLVGRLSFDPLAFTQLPAREQVRALLDIVDLPFDPAALEAERRQLFDDRTDVNRQVKRAEGYLSTLGRPGRGVPEEEVSVADLVAQVQDAERVNRDRAALVQRLEWQTSTVARLRQELAREEDVLTQLDTDIGSLPDPADTTALEQQLRDADATNAAVRDARKYREAQATLRQHEESSEEITQHLARLDKQKRDGLAAATMPVEGLGFDDDGVTYQGVPFAQCSGAEQLRVSVAMAIAANPRLRVIRITDGSLLDTANLALLERMAQAEDFQVWIERVDDSGQVGIVIHDGEVVSVP